MIDIWTIITLFVAIGWLFVPALILTVLTGSNMYNFIGFIAIFMVIGSLPTFNILPSWFSLLGVLIAGIFLYMSITNRGGN